MKINRIMIASLGLLIAMGPALRAKDKADSNVDKQMLELFDVNHDGKLDADEEATKAAMILRFDKNEDGQLDKNELRALEAGRKTAAEKQAAEARKQKMLAEKAAKKQ